MIDKKIVFDERYDNENHETTTLYFVAPKEMLEQFGFAVDKEDVSMEISIEFPINHIEPAYADVCISPTSKIDGVMTDYDWHDIDLPYDEIEELINLATKA